MTARTPAATLRAEAEALARELFITSGLYQRAGVYPPTIPEERIRTIVEYGLAAQAAQRAADAEVLERWAAAYPDSATGDAMRADAAAIRSGPPAPACVLGARDGGHACACDPQPAAAGDALARLTAHMAACRRCCAPEDVLGAGAGT